MHNELPPYPKGWLDENVMRALLAEKTVGSLFSGVGGFEHGMEPCGFTPLWSVEKDAACRGVLRYHFPNTEIYEDVLTFDPLTVRRPAGLVGGSPCQGFSISGRQEGLDDDRSGLFREYLRILRELAPPFFIFENVPGLLTTNGGRDALEVVDALAQSGYCLAWRILDSQHFGVAQRRRRIFIVGAHEALGRARAERLAQILFEQRSLRGDTAPCRAGQSSPAARRRTGTQAESGSLTPYESQSNQILSAEGLAPTLRTEGGGGCHLPIVMQDQPRTFRYSNQDNPLVEDSISATLRSSCSSTDERSVAAYVLENAAKESAAGGSKQGGGCLTNWDKQRFRIHSETVLAPTLFANVNGGGHGVPTILQTVGMQVKEPLKVSVWDMTHASEGLRYVGEDFAPVLQARMGTGGNQVPVLLLEPQPVMSQGRPEKSRFMSVTDGQKILRRLTPTECERLQAFPDGWTAFISKEKDAKGEGYPLAAQSDTARYKQMGNSVTTTVIRWIAEGLDRAISEICDKKENADVNSD